MLKHLLSFTCMNKKERKKLAITSPDPPLENSGLDDTLDKSMAVPTEESVLDTSPFMSKVLGDVSLDAANLQNRTTPIDFGTKEVKENEDVLSLVGRRHSVNTITPSPIPEEIEEPAGSSSAVQPRKFAKLYHSHQLSPNASTSTDDSLRIDSVRARASKSAINGMYKGKFTPVIGGSLRPARTKRHSMAFGNDAQFYSLDKRSPLLRLRRRDSSRRDAVEAGFEPRDAVPRCHSTQSLRDVQRVKAYSNSQFQTSNLSLDPNGRVLSTCDSTTAAPTAVVNPARHHHHQHPDVDRRRSLQALTTASSLYQMNNRGAPPNGRSQFSPSELGPAVHNHVGSRVRVSSVNQICDSTSTPQFSIEQRRSTHNINHQVRNSFLDGIKTTSTPKNQVGLNFSLTLPFTRFSDLCVGGGEVLQNPTYPLFT
uniref:Uncharacterized protein n=1 Tax=Caenorhabditis japonica TaxID=281687 RepID=A0A8R1DGB6_CAEJA